jgi:hypothetical protein
MLQTQKLETLKEIIQKTQQQEERAKHDFNDNVLTFIENEVYERTKTSCLSEFKLQLELPREKRSHLDTYYIKRQYQMKLKSHNLHVDYIDAMVDESEYDVIRCLYNCSSLFLSPHGMPCAPSVSSYNETPVIKYTIVIKLSYSENKL